MTDSQPNTLSVVGRIFRGVAPANGRIAKLPVLLLLVVLFVLKAKPSDAQNNVNINAANTFSPRDTLKSFIDACNEIHHLGSETKYFDRYDPEHLAIIDPAVDCIDQIVFPHLFARNVLLKSLSA